MTSPTATEIDPKDISLFKKNASIATLQATFGVLFATEQMASNHVKKHKHKAVASK